eukprot:XP_024998642.1 uncharacterized protein LOC107050901 isoform X2 [Gallus gallus]
MQEAMRSSEKEAALQEPRDAEKGCCSTGCCSGACCKACCLPCSLCCPTCCLPGCGCTKGCGCMKSCGCTKGCGCMKSCVCFVPRLLCSLPRKLLGCHRLRCVLVAVLLLLLLVLIVAAALLMWLRAEQLRDNGVLRAAAEWGRGWDEDAVTFYVDSGDGAPGTVVYDYGKAAAGTPTAVAERSLLGPTVNILCSAVPIYWA